jgi:uncharacterized coiled-coil protein SlyX
MKKIIEFIKKYKTQILIVLTVLFFFRTCSNSTQVRKLEKTKIENQHTIDSLNGVINEQKDTITKISDVIKAEKIKLHMEYNNWITPQDRTKQLIELHKIVNKNINELQKD